MMTNREALRKTIADLNKTIDKSGAIDSEVRINACAVILKAIELGCSLTLKQLDQEV